MKNVKTLDWENLRMFSIENKGLGAHISTPNFELWKESKGTKVYGIDDDRIARGKMKRKGDDGAASGGKRGERVVLGVVIGVMGDIE